ncbi:MAG TPA: Lrp/AsnC family transcriptional regulator [Gammaproteobacteria bacterium]|nr:Lrp/AsnC family transcriptional regulator [Gammaproteobacteria bacterium]
MEALTRRLLNDYQHGFPLAPAPFEAIAHTLCTDSDTVIQRLRHLQRAGAVSRVGPVFRPNTVGASTLATMSLPPRELERVAALVNTFPEVNHNYEREHRYNLWFVVTARDTASLEHTLAQIEHRCGHPLLSLPLLRDYHIDLGFPMQLDTQPDPAGTEPVVDDTASAHEQAGNGYHDTGSDDLIEAVQEGLPLVARPYLEIARSLGWSEARVIETLRRMLEGGVIKRLGIVVRHHELGYQANAMVVWDIPDFRTDELGVQLGRQDCVTLCYQRPRRLPDWPYNLFCMVHGRDRTQVEHCVHDMRRTLGIETVPHEILFSGRRFKQRGARYRGIEKEETGKWEVRGHGRY